MLDLDRDPFGREYGDSRAWLARGGGLLEAYGGVVVVPSSTRHRLNPSKKRGRGFRSRALLDLVVERDPAGTHPDHGRGPLQRGGAWCGSGFAVEALAIGRLLQWLFRAVAGFEATIQDHAAAFKATWTLL